MSGPDAIETLLAYNNLGSLRVDQGRLQEAEALLLHALRGREAALGKKHPETLMTVVNVSLLRAKQLRKREAIELQDRAHRGELEQLGADHPQTTASQNVLQMLKALESSAGDSEWLEFVHMLSNAD